ncbi:NAD(P)/FAD-dependent oxidoreductase [Geopsychrobacter electrodiphilus]|uniref:NAD(P)/FAD-dependent oxidoreductase n=1 Tax=Geopsychrobacter electrodiphilus TaxID=225196 RepID=UPI000377F8E0|nr:FAD-dependent monooxygenase [Geopsychrobacter electrodiphilus]
MRRPLEIIGAGPAGLAAALTIARAGGKAIVYERHSDVGTRFHGDFQGLENWTTGDDVLEELAELGIEATFEYQAFRECLFFDDRGKEYLCRSALPLWYLVRRGGGAGSLDQVLKQQALTAGVEIRFNTEHRHLPAGGIVAYGPRRTDVVAAGYLFETDCPDGAYAVVSDQIAPKGYAYLLVSGGRGTMAVCQFADLRSCKTYLDKAVDFFQKKIGLRMTNSKFFSGFGNIFPSRRARKGQLLYAGEAAGFQDALFGFGMRYAMVSGHLAAQAMLAACPEDYEILLKRRFESMFKLSVVNRYIYESLGTLGYHNLLQRLCSASDPRAWLQHFYCSGRVRKLAFPFVRRSTAHKAELVTSCKEGCDCIFCRCRPAVQAKLSEGGLK